MLKDQINNPIQQENLIDITGHPIDWYNSEEGWTDQRRHNVLIANDLMMEQFKNVPAYTKYGYKKMIMPKKLHHQILKSINLKSSKLTDEIMHPRDAVSNWQRVTKNGTTGNAQKLNPSWNDKCPKASPIFCIKNNITLFPKEFQN